MCSILTAMHWPEEQQLVKIEWIQILVHWLTSDDYDILSIAMICCQLQTTLQQSQASALEMQSQLQSMTEEISLLQTSKDQVGL